MIEKLRNLFRRSPRVPESEPKVIYMSTTINPISRERYEFLRLRKVVVEPMINKLKKYAYSTAAGVATTNVLDALKAAQTELILIDLEMEVLKEYFEKRSETPAQMIK